MRKLENASMYGASEGVGCQLFLALFGTVIMGLGIKAFIEMRTVWSWPMLRQSPSLALLLLGMLIFVAFGLNLVWGGLSQAAFYSRFTEQEAQVTPENIRPGDRFTFAFGQHIQQSVWINSVAVFLVFRETVRYYNGSEQKQHYVDRLVDYFVQPDIGAERIEEAVSIRRDFQERKKNVIRCWLQPRQQD